MHFRLTYGIAGYNVALKDNSLTLEVGGPYNISVVLSQTSAQPGNLIQAVAQTDPPPKATSALQEMQQGIDNPPRSIDADPAPSPAKSFDSLVPSLRQFSLKLYSELSDAIVDSFALIRWRFALSGPVRPYSSLNFEWSENGESWYVLPRMITLRLRGTVQRRLRADDAVEVESIIASHAEEPLSHKLLSEARASASETGSYSSALVMSMAALEIGAKHLIAELVPTARWLALEVPTPPIVRVIKEYLPTLPEPRLVNGKTITAPPSVLKTLSDAVTARNRAAHAGLDLPKPEFVERVLGAVGDMLWIFDFYAGNLWAINHLSHESKAELGLVLPLGSV